MEELYDFWKNNTHLWFNSTHEDDIFLTNKYIYLFDNKYIIIHMNKKEWTSYVLLYDQIIKHVNRCDNNIKQPENFIENCYLKYNEFKDDINEFEFMFMLMPIRHTHKLFHVKFVLNETWKRLNFNPTLKKYLTATYERYIKCSSDVDNIIKYEKTGTIFINNDILDDKCVMYNSNHSHSEFYKQIEPLVDLPKCKSTDIIFNNTHYLITIFKDFLEKHKLTDKLITVSISGGVDSMICSYILKQLDINFICVHIDYYNRSECLHEEELLKWWCNTILDVPLYIRRIDEINRPKCMEYELRELYESYTKNIRFNSYITTSPNPIVMLGHNKDDTIENIFTNMASNSHYENLLGMTEYSTQTHNIGSLTHSIHFIRPLLNTIKKDIYDFALEHNIPFLVDSTPKWSQRGKIRDVVRPALETWNPLILDGLIKMSERMTQLNELVNKLITSDINFDTINNIPLDIIYWEVLLKKHNIYITHKTMKELIKKIIYLQNNLHKNKIHKFILCKNHYLEFIISANIKINII
jgi:tRNA(Ile)-lysidine synthetase-like protein